MLSNEIRSTLGGRYIEVNVFPYDFKEFLNVKGIRLTFTALYATQQRSEVLRAFDDIFHHGGLPEGAELSSKRDYLSNV